ncbi:MAG: glycoside hydrolase family 25 protein [Clostridium sp.]|nr:glycoside hydrolase family 25 protein [Acetatifactor muris]MCM1525926.1 glycoside hydrolase family 25 protein [Bacteroides sp.]MCM1562535.1 glycoside hydrolase family 25 protein [Clostridium sp.]
MDSKLKKTAVLSCMAAILIVAATVLYANRDVTPDRPQVSNKTQDETQTRDESQSGGQAIRNGQIGNDLKAFERDEGFFDPILNPVLEAAKDMSNRLSLVVTSVEKDLRIQVVNNEGIPVEGEGFFVELTGAGETESDREGSYKDLDQDGVIYIGDLAAGEYFVQLSPISGYKVPVSQTRVRVKDKVEYLAIDDISLLIKTEDEVDAEAEDSRVRDALADADKTEMTDLKFFSGRTLTGIDVSKWNGDIDWDKVKNAGVEFAIVRAGYRGSVTGSLVQDIYFDANMKGASSSGIPVGIYFFTQATNEVEAVEEASAVLKWVREYDITYPIFIDTEGAGGNGRADGLDADTRTLVCEAFCRTIENAGYKSGVYASRNWYNHNLHTERLEDYYIWLAEYRSVPLYQGYYRMWQYSSKGKIDGISGNVDMNIMYE